MSTPSTRPTTAAPICPTSRSSPPFSAPRRRHSVFHRLEGPSCRHRRHHPRVHAAGQLDGHGRRDPDRQFPPARGRTPARNPSSLTYWDPGPGRRATPARTWPTLRAQIAANEKGTRELRKMIDHFGLDVVRAYMGHVQDNAEECVSRVLDVLAEGIGACEMDDGSVIKVAIMIDREARRATIDFTGTSKQQKTNFNAPFSVTRAAVLYVFRTLVDDDIPLNSGCLKPLSIITPEGCMLNPTFPAAVWRETWKLASGGRCPLLSPRRDSGKPGHNEQFHLRKRHISILRDPVRRLRRRTGLRWDRRRAHPHDQYPPDRSGSPGMALSSASGGILHSRRKRRQGSPKGRRRRRPPHPIPRTDDGIDMSSHRRVPPRGMNGGSPGRREGTPSNARTAWSRNWAAPTRPPCRRATSSSSRLPAAADTEGQKSHAEINSRNNTAPPHNICKYSVNTSIIKIYSDVILHDVCLTPDLSAFITPMSSSKDTPWLAEVCFMRIARRLDP